MLVSVLVVFVPVLVLFFTWPPKDAHLHGGLFHLQRVRRHGQPVGREVREAGMRVDPVVGVEGADPVEERQRCGRQTPALLQIR